MTPRRIVVLLDWKFSLYHTPRLSTRILHSCDVLLTKLKHLLHCEPNVLCVCDKDDRSNSKEQTYTEFSMRCIIFQVYFELKGDRFNQYECKSSRLKPDSSFWFEGLYTIDGTNFVINKCLEWPVSRWSCKGMAHRCSKLYDVIIFSWKPLHFHW